MNSLIIPFYNNYNNLDLLSDALSRQSLMPNEIIIVDDASFIPLHRDKLNIEHDNLHIIRNNTGKGPACSRNIAIEKANGKYLVFLDSDCIPSKEWFANIIGLLEKGYQVIAGGAIQTPASLFEKWVSFLGYPAGGNLGFENMWKVDENGYTRHLSSCNFAVDKEVLDQYKLRFCEDFLRAGCEDVYFAENLNHHNIKIYYASAITVEHETKKHFITFIKWHFLRGRSAYMLKKKMTLVNKLILMRLRTFFVITKKVPALHKFPVMVLFCVQVFVQGLAYYWEKLSNILTIPIRFQKYH